MARTWLSTKCLTFDKIPTVFDSFKQSSLICLFQVKLESNVMPRYLVESTFLINHYVSHQVQTETADQNSTCHVRDWSSITSWGEGGVGAWACVTGKLCARHKNALWLFSVGDLVLESLFCAQRLWILNLVFSTETKKLYFPDVSHVVYFIAKACYFCERNLPSVASNKVVIVEP